MALADKPTQLSEQVLESVKTGQLATLEEVRKFVDTVDEALPRLGGSTVHAAAGDRLWAGDGRRPR